MVSMAVDESLFPDLVRTGYRITSPPDPAYNCIAWAVGVADAWWWPDPDGFDYWPTGVARERTLAAFTEALGTVGFVPCADASLELGWDKVAIFAMVRHTRPGNFRTAAGPASSARMMTSSTTSRDSAVISMEPLCRLFADKLRKRPCTWRFKWPSLLMSLSWPNGTQNTLRTMKVNTTRFVSK